MARLHSGLGERTVYTTTGVAAAQGMPCTVYTNAAGTVLANLAAYNPATPGTPGGVITGAALVVDEYSNRPAFWDLDDRDVLYISVNDGPVVPILPDAQPQIRALQERVDDIEPPDGFATVEALNEEISARATAVANAATAAAIDATTKANAARASAVLRENHQGVQPTSTILGLDATLAAKADLVNGVIPTSQVPAISLVTFLGPVGSQAGMLALSGQPGDWCTRTDLGTTWQITGPDPTQLGSWTELLFPSGGVSSVNGQTGPVVLGQADIGLANVDNVSAADLRDRATHTGTQSADTVVDGTTRVVMLASEREKLSGIQPGATANSPDAQLRDRSTHTGLLSADDVADGLVNKSFTGAERTKLTAIQAGATANATDAQLRDRATHTGNMSADNLVDGATNKAFLGTERSKLATIPANATANSSDAQLRDRATHTGTQPHTTISGLGNAATRNVGTTSTTVAAGDAPAAAQAAAIAVAADDATAKVAAVQAGIAGAAAGLALVLGGI